MPGLDVLGEDHDARSPGAGRGSRARRAGPRRCSVGGMRMSTIATSGSCSSTAREQLLGGRRLGHDVDARAPQERGDALAHQRAVVGDHDAHGSSAVTTVPAPGGLVTRSVPSSASTRSARPCRPEPVRRVRAADAVVGDLDTRRRRACATARTDAVVACGVLGDVGERLAGDEVDRELDRLAARRSGASHDTAVGTVERVASDVERRRQAVVEHAGWMPRASSRSSSSEFGELVARARPRAPRPAPGRVRMSDADHPQLQRDRDEPLLRAVVQVALEPAALGVAGRDDALARRLQLGEPGVGLRLQALVLERDRRRGARPPRPSPGRRRARRRRRAPRPRARRARSARSRRSGGRPAARARRGRPRRRGRGHPGSR